MGHDRHSKYGPGAAAALASLLALEPNILLSVCLSVCIAHETLWHCRGAEGGGFSWATEGCRCAGPQLAARVLTDGEHTAKAKVEHTRH